MNWIKKIFYLIFGKRRYIYFSEPYYAKNDIFKDSFGDMLWVRDYEWQNKDSWQYKVIKIK